MRLTLKTALAALLLLASAFVVTGPLAADADARPDPPRTSVALKPNSNHNLWLLTFPAQDQWILDEINFNVSEICRDDGYGLTLDIEDLTVTNTFGETVPGVVTEHFMFIDNTHGVLRFQIEINSVRVEILLYLNFVEQLPYPAPGQCLDLLPTDLNQLRIQDGYYRIPNTNLVEHFPYNDFDVCVTGPVQPADHEVSFPPPNDDDDRGGISLVSGGPKTSVPSFLAPLTPLGKAQALAGAQ